MKQQEQAAPVKQAREQVKSNISKQVFDTLGHPGNLQSLQVRHLWTDHFRVNVMVGSDAASSRVAHSYFLMVDSDGGIINSVPSIKKVY